jgi:hypothetical protein
MVVPDVLETKLGKPPGIGPDRDAVKEGGIPFRRVWKESP